MQWQYRAIVNGDLKEQYDSSWSTFMCRASFMCIHDVCLQRIHKDKLIFGVEEEPPSTLSALKLSQRFSAFVIQATCLWKVTFISKAFKRRLVQNFLSSHSPGSLNGSKILSLEVMLYLFESLRTVNLSFPLYISLPPSLPPGKSPIS